MSFTVKLVVPVSVRGYVDCRRDRYVDGCGVAWKTCWPDTEHRLIKKILRYIESQICGTLIGKTP